MSEIQVSISEPTLASQIDAILAQRLEHLERVLNANDQQRELHNEFARLD